MNRVEPVQFIMERKLLLNIKRLAEQTVVGKEEPEPAHVMKQTVVRVALVVLGLVLIGHALIHLGIITGGMLGPMEEQDGRATPGCWISSWMLQSSG